MATTEIFHCFGFEILGLCKYDPRSPSPSYFTIGDAVAALAFTIAVQQLLKPIYLFRLRALGIRFWYIVIAVFFGSSLTIVAAAVPNINLPRDNALAFPVFWEIIGGIVIGAAYATVAVVSLRPAALRPWNAENFIRAAAILLSEANDEDRLSFAKDLFENQNLTKLLQISSELDRAQRHAVQLEFERKQQDGLELVVQGTPQISPFYEFARRRQLDLAEYSYELLELLSDPDFCRVVAINQSWPFLRSIKDAAENSVDTKAGKSFVQSVIWQSLLLNDSMLARETSYDGFGISRSFAYSFFGNARILEAFEPLNSVRSFFDVELNKRVIARLNLAAEITTKSEIDEYGFWRCNSIRGLTFTYGHVLKLAYFERSKSKCPDWLHEIGDGVEELIDAMNSALQKCEPQIHDMLFQGDDNKFRADAVYYISKIIYESIECISFNFNGYEDDTWIYVQGIFEKIYPRFNDNNEGLSPLQQALAIRLIDKVRENMRGYHPAVLRTLVSLVGPLLGDGASEKRDAFSIVREATYVELKRISSLYDTDPQKVVALLPPNVIYNRDEDSLTHKYRGGIEQITYLKALNLDGVDLRANENLHRRALGESAARGSET